MTESYTQTLKLGDGLQENVKLNLIPSWDLASSLHCKPQANKMYLNT